MSVRVNLMVPEEFRASSAITTSVSPRVLAITGGAVVATLLALGTVHFRMVGNGLKLAQARYATVEPRYKEAMRIQADRNHNHDIMKEMDGWAASGVAWREPLRILGGLVPDSVQFTRLTLDSSIEKPRPSRPTDAEKQPPPPPPVRRYTIRIDGAASGELSDQTVVDFVKTLRESPAFLDWIESVQLQGLQRAVAQNAGPDDRVFRIDLRTYAREM